MGRKDNVSKEYLSKSEYFADAFNYYLYDGERVIDPDDLKEREPSVSVKIGRSGKGTVQGRIRDILKRCVIKSDSKTTYVLLGIENQSELHYAMPVRNMLYDALNYSDQVRETDRKHRKKKDMQDSAEFLSGFTNEDKLIPVITLVVYWGDKEWKAPRRLSEMFDNHDHRLASFIADYEINLIAPEEIVDFNRFHTDLGAVLEMIKRQNEDDVFESMIRDRGEDWSLSRESVEVINEFINADIDTEREEGGRIIMCRASEALVEKGVRQGIEQNIISMICKKLIKGKDAVTIADEIEEPVERVSKICNIASKYLPDYDVHKIMEELR